MTTDESAWAKAHPTELVIVCLVATASGLLTCMAVNGCAESRNPAPASSAARATASVSADANSPAPYFHLDSVQLADINRAFRKDLFTRRDLDDPWKVWNVLQVVTQAVDMQMEPNAPTLAGMRLVSTWVASPMYNGNPKGWLRGTEESESVFRELDRDPQLALKGDDWTATFNVFNRDGRVDQWRIAGAHDPQANILHLKSVEVARLKPPETFRWPRAP